MRKPIVILVAAILFCLVLSSVAAAAIPDNTVIVGNRAYDLTYLETDDAAQTAIATGIAHVYIVLSGNMLRATDGSPATVAEIVAFPSIIYTGPYGETRVFSPANESLL